MNAEIQNLQQQVANLQAQVNQMGSSQQTSSSGAGQFVQLNSGLSSQMLGNFGGVNREMNILNAKSMLQDETLYLGGYAQTGISWSTANKKIYGLSNSSKSETVFSLDDVSLSLLGNLNQYAAVYVQQDMNSIGQSGGNTSPQFNQVYVLLGNNSMPVYGFAGRKDIDFGNFSTVNMFAQPTTRNLFEVNGTTAGIGYNAYGFNVVASAMNGGSNGSTDVYGGGIWNPYLGYAQRTGNTISNTLNGLYTSSEAQLSNFALNANYGMNTYGVNWSLGAGYLNGIWMGQQYAISGTTVTNGLAATSKRVGAWDLNAQVGFQGLTVLAEFVTTAQNITFTNSRLFNNLLLNGGNGKVDAWDLGTSYGFNAGFIPNQSVVSFDYSGSKIGSSSPVNVNQYVLGARNEIFPKANVWAGLEYAYQHVTNIGIGTVNNNNVRLNLTASF